MTTPRQEVRAATAAGIERLVMAAFAAEPMLSLTTAQAGRLWHLDAATSDQVLQQLVRAGVLSRASAGGYHRADVLQPMDPALIP